MKLKGQLYFVNPEKMHKMKKIEKKLKKPIDNAKVVWYNNKAFDAKVRAASKKLNLDN